MTSLPESEAGSSSGCNVWDCQNGEYIVKDRAGQVHIFVLLFMLYNGCTMNIITSRH